MLLYVTAAEPSIILFDFNIFFVSFPATTSFSVALTGKANLSINCPPRAYYIPSIDTRETHNYQNRHTGFNCRLNQFATECEWASSNYMIRAAERRRTRLEGNCDSLDPIDCVRMEEDGTLSVQIVTVCGFGHLGTFHNRNPITRARAIMIDTQQYNCITVITLSFDNNTYSTPAPIQWQSPNKVHNTLSIQYIFCCDIIHSLPVTRSRRRSTQCTFQRRQDTNTKSVHQE